MPNCINTAYLLTETAIQSARVIPYAVRYTLELESCAVKTSKSTEGGMTHPLPLQSPPRKAV